MRTYTKIIMQYGIIYLEKADVNPIIASSTFLYDNAIKNICLCCDSLTCTGSKRCKRFLAGKAEVDTIKAELLEQGAACVKIYAQYFNKDGKHEKP